MNEAFKYLMEWEQRRKNPGKQKILTSESLWYNFCLVQNNFLAKTDLKAGEKAPFDPRGSLPAQDSKHFLQKIPVLGSRGSFILAF